MSVEPKHIQIARNYIGIKEGPGAADNKIIVNLYSLAGHPEVKHDAVPWCAAFVAAMLTKAGVTNEVPGPKRLWALAYAKLGTKLAEPIYGCVGVKARKGGGHVTFIVAANKTHVWGLGGNQKDGVNIAQFNRADFVAWRWPTGVLKVGLPPLPVSLKGALVNPSQA